MHGVHHVHINDRHCSCKLRIQSQMNNPKRTAPTTVAAETKYFGHFWSRVFVCVSVFPLNFEHSYWHFGTWNYPRSLWHSNINWQVLCHTNKSHNLWGLHLVLPVTKLVGLLCIECIWDDKDHLQSTCEPVIMSGTDKSNVLQYFM